MYTIFILLILGILLWRFRHTKIKFKTFFKKGFRPKRGVFGVYCYCGKQGSGKSYSAVEFILNNLDMPIYANLSSLKDVDYTYFNGFDELLKLRDKKDCIIFFDEIFTILSRKSSSKLNKKQIDDVLDFLSQMRKRGIIFITTAQEWLEIDMTLRRYCRYQVDCTMRDFRIFGVLIKRVYDAEQMKWSNDDNEYIAPHIETTISKCNVSVAKRYDTFEQIKS